jgi:hypothetical protein
MTAQNTRPRSRTGRRRLALALGTLALAAGCNVLNVDNPNNVSEDSLADPSAATPLANGVAATTVRGLNSVLDPYSTVSDELDFVGSQDGFFQLDVGNVSTPVIQFTDQGFQRIAEARWTADQALARLLAWDKDGRLSSRADLANTYLYGAIVYTTIGDMFDDFTLSDRMTSAAPIGETNMKAVYDTAVAYLDRGLAVATAINSAPLRTQILGMRARAKFSRALWVKLNPPGKYGGTPAPITSPLVNDAEASADATAALALMGSADYAFTITPSSQNTAGNNLGNDLNTRREMRIGQAYAQPDPAAQGQNRTLIANGQPVIVLNDPVTNAPDVALRARVNALITGGQFLPMTVVSAREMQLILAEAALAAGSQAEVVSRINAVRTLAGETPAWNGTSPDALTMLRFERRVNLFLQGRRLQDMYRFGERDARWQTASVAYTTRGCFFPITTTERLSNAKVTTQPVCSGL